MEQFSDTIAAVCTGGVVSAVGILRLSGPGVLGVVEKVFSARSGRPVREFPDRKLIYGELRDREGRLLDLCLCTVSRAPNSYTGEDTAELQCHGSPMVLREGLESLFAAGARQAGPGEFTRRAFLNGRMDLTAAEAVADLIDAESPLAARNAAGQLDGAVFRRAEGVYSALTDICAHFHAVIDYPDEDIDPFETASYRGVMESALRELKTLLASHSRGRLLEKGVRTALLGRPNVGKSSLLNALLGYERAIVTDVPGTTRDTLSERVLLGNVLLRLTDTAGLRQTEDAVEKLGVERSLAAAREADLILAVFDAAEPLSAGDRELIHSTAAPAARRVALLNKSDKPACLTAAELQPFFDAVLPVSALTGDGLQALTRTVEKLFPLPEAAAGELLTNARQAEAVGRAAEALEAALTALDAGFTPDAVLCGAEDAMAALAELTGRSVRGDVTDRIFARFCVGK